MSGEHWVDRLSDYLDGELSADDRARLEHHLSGCPECAHTLDQLSAVVARARSLPSSPPRRDLWPDIAGAIGAPTAGSVPAEAARSSAGVDELPLRVVPAARRRISFSIPQLAAASVVLAIASALVGRRIRSEPDVPTAQPVPSADAVRLAGQTAPPPGYADELSRLQRALDEGRSRLDPNTVRILDKNLAVIDRAIRESQQALAVDPGNPFLEDHLERAYRGKVDYLREATAMLQWGA